MILAGDIGGTKTHLALFDKKDKRKIYAQAKYVSSQFENLEAILKKFFSEHPSRDIECACFGIAGPIQEGKCKATNLPWVVDSAIVAEETGIPHVFLINDLEANCYGINYLDESEFFVLNEGKKVAGNAALISAGTGLGEAGMYWDGVRHHPFPSEGGHCSFAPESELEVHVLQYLKQQYDHVSFERVLSGPGLYRLYRFFIDSGIEKEKEATKREMETRDPPRVVAEMGLKRADEACVRALYWFISIYGSEAANLALKMLSVGGLYIGGGIAPNILNALREGGFMKRFIHKGRFTSLLLAIPVKVILNDNTALLGAAYYARECRKKADR